MRSITGATVAVAPVFIGLETGTRPANAQSQQRRGANTSVAGKAFMWVQQAHSHSVVEKYIDDRQAGSRRGGKTPKWYKCKKWRGRTHRWCSSSRRMNSRSQCTFADKRNRPRRCNHWFVRSDRRLLRTLAASRRQKYASACPQCRTSRSRPPKNSSVPHTILGNAALCRQRQAHQGR